MEILPASAQPGDASHVEWPAPVVVWGTEVLTSEVLLPLSKLRNLHGIDLVGSYWIHMGMVEPVLEEGGRH